MADWMVKLQKVLQVIAFIVGAVLGLMGQDKKVQTEVSAVSGAYASSADAAGDIAKAGNLSTAGMASLLSTVVIPFVFQFIGQWVGKKPPKPGYVAVADRTACETLILTRANVPADLEKVKDLMTSGVQLDIAQRLEAVKPKVA